MLEGRCEINAWDGKEGAQGKEQFLPGNVVWLARESLMRAGTVRENQSRPWGTDPSYRQRRTLIDRIRKALRHQKEGYLTMNGNI